MNKNVIRSISLVVAGMCIGGGTGYLIATKRLEKTYARIARAEINSVKETYRLLRKEPPYDDPRTAVVAYGERLDQLQYWHDNGVDEETEPSEPPAIFEEMIDDQKKIETINHATENIRLGDAVTFDGSNTVHLEKSPSEPTEIVNIFDKDDETQDEEDEEDVDDGPEAPIPSVVPRRNSTTPYIIKVAEFMEDQPERAKITLTYYEKDEVITDDQDSPVPEVMEILGRANLQFGMLSGDPNTVYIRNDGRDVDFEVLRHESSYAQEVLGISPQTMLSKVPKVRRRESPDG